jgi:hypothetical protein
MQQLKWIVVLFLLVVSCAHKEKAEETKPKTEADAMRLVARVQSRPGGKEFVLLEAYGKWTLQEGTNLLSYGTDGRTASLVTSGEKLGQFVAADVQSGQVEIGDAVYHRTKAAPSSTLTTPAPTQATPASAPAAPKVEEKAPASKVIEPVPLPSY